MRNSIVSHILHAYGRRNDFITIVSKLYKDIYDARNTFLHGNRLSISCIYPFKNPKQKSLNVYAPLIYKVALLSNLNIFKDHIVMKNILNHMNYQKVTLYLCTRQI